MNVYRPRGVKALATLLIFFGVGGIIWGYLNGILWSIFTWPDLPDLVYVLILFSKHFLNQYLFQPHHLILWQLFKMSIPIYLILCLITGIGLLSMKKWGYNLALITGTLGTLGGILIVTIEFPNISDGIFELAVQSIPLIDIVGISNLILGVAIIIYLLLTDVKHEFE
ncbi:MAG: hypothetical protein ACETWM_01575 [Candidatus Lokiarchaeia archaeon]